MTRSSSAVAVALLMAIPAWAQASDQRLTFPTAVELVKVDVVVLGKAEQPVVGLSRDDFTILEDGVVQPIQSFEAIIPALADPPDQRSLAGLLRRRVSVNTDPGKPKDSPHFLFLFDSHRLSLDGARRAAQGIRHFLAGAAAPSDRITLASTLGSLTWTGLSRDIQGLLSATDAGEAEPMPTPADPPEVKGEGAEVDRQDSSLDDGTKTKAKPVAGERLLAALLTLDPKTLAHECRPET